MDIINYCIEIDFIIYSDFNGSVSIINDGKQYICGCKTKSECSKEDLCNKYNYSKIIYQNGILKNSENLNLLDISNYENVVQIIEVSSIEIF
jgi:hypothetical protein